MTDAPPAPPTAEPAPAAPSTTPPASPPSSTAPRPTRLAASTSDTPPPAPAPQGDRVAPPTPTAEPAAPPILGDDLSLRPGWVDALGDEYRDHYKTGAKFDNLGALLKSYSHLERLRGIPDANADPDVQAAFRDANKIPSDAQEYAKAIALPEGQEIAPDILAKAAAAGIQANMHPSQMAQMMALQMELADEARQTFTQAAEAEKEAAFQQLEQEWGNDTSANYSNAQAAARMLGLDVADPNIGDNPSLVRALSQLHSKLDEDTLRSVSAAGPVNNGGGQGARAKARDIVTNPNNPLYKAYNDPSDPGHAQAHQKVDAYNAEATGFRP